MADDDDDKGDTGKPDKEDVDGAQKALEEITQLLQKNNYLGVITTCAKNPPNVKDAAFHKKFADPVLEALRQVKKTTLESTLSSFEEHEREVILKYVYYGFHAKPEYATDYLAWQQAIVKKDGVGAIVRILTDIKRNVLSTANIVEM